MEALISGQAARAVFISGTDVSYLDADSPHELIQITRSDIPWVLGEVTDIQSMAVEKPADCFPVLLKKYSLDRGLRLLDIALSDEDSNEIRLEAAAEFLRILDDETVCEAVKNCVYSCHNERVEFSEQTEEAFRDLPEFVEFLHNLADHQIHIISFRSALEKSFERNGLSQAESISFHSHAVETGVFRKLVEAKSDGSRVNGVILNAYLKLNSLPNSRVVIQDWTNQFLDQRTKRSLKALDREFEEFSKSNFSPAHIDEKSAYERFQSVRKQQASIIEKLEAGEVQLARRYTNEMIKEQLGSGNGEYAAKSLSLLATEARKLGRQSIELEWAKYAADLAPDDGMATGILADTFLRLFRLKEADEAFQRAIDSGEESFGRVGQARVLKAGGKLDEALALFNSLQSKIDKADSERIYVWMGQCSVLRDMWKLDEALETSSSALQYFPDSALLNCQHAAILSDLGNLDEALSKYADTERRFPNEVVAICGLASVHHKMGNLQEASAIYSRARDKFPNEYRPVVGLASTLSDKGSHAEAIDILLSSKARFPHQPTAYLGLAEAYRNQRDFESAVSVYDEAIAKFPLNSVARCGRANVLKLSGKFEEALQAYEQNVQDFPYDLVSLGGRADLLRRLGDYDSAIRAYDDIVNRHPGYKYAKTAKLGVLVAQGKFDEATALMPETTQNTEDDWVTRHLNGMISLGKGDLEDAERIFKNGMESVPFYRHRIYFQTALACVQIRKKEFSQAVSQLRDLPKEIVPRLLLVHSYCELGNFDAALQVFEAANDNLAPPVSELRNEIGARFGLSKGKAVHDEAWIYRREAELLVLAA